MVKWIKNKGIKFLYFSSIVVLFLLLNIFNVFKSFDNMIMDVYQKPGSPSNITIIKIDEKTINQLGTPDNWQRDKYISVLDKLNLHGKPSVIAFDILFTGEKDSTSDELFANKCAEYGNVITANLLEFRTTIDISTHTYSNKINNISLPYEKLNNVTESGFTNTILDTIDNKARRLMPIVDYNNQEYYSLSYLAYMRYANNMGLNINDYKNNKTYRFKYTAKPASTYQTISFVDLYNDEYDVYLEDEIVLIGAYAEALQDDYYTPIAGGKKMYGVEIHANMIDAFIKNNIIYESNHIAMTIILFIVLLLIAFIIYKSNILVTSIASVLSIFIAIAIQSISMNFNYYLPLNSFILWILIIFVANVLVTWLVEKIRKQKIVNIFKKYVAKEVVESALKNLNYDVNLGGLKKNIACLFVDIRGFTTMSEVLTPEEVVEILNKYLDLTTKSVFAYGGTVDKFIGDCTMAVYNSPFDLEDYAFKAIKSALMMRSMADELEKELFDKYGRSVSFGIGINMGEAVVGNIGSKDRMDYTAIGDTVNTAERLESKAKKGQIIISDTVYESLKDRIIVEDLGILELKGKANGIHAYNVLNIYEEE